MSKHIVSNFLKAARKKLRFATTKGSLSAEQLFDLNLESLDNLGKALRKQIRDNSEESLIGKQTRANSDDELRFEIIKDVISIKLNEADARSKRAERASQIREVQDAIETQRGKQLQEADLATLQSRLASLLAEEEN